MDGHDENKNTNNGGNVDTNSAAPNTQGIFSTPELTVDAEKIAQPEQSSGDKSRVASFFADTDATKQAQQVKNAMLTPSTSVAEDIVIDNGGKKKSKMPIIAAIIAALVIICSLIVFLIINGLSNNSDNQTEQLSAKEAYNSYMNYLLRGDNSTSDFNLDQDSFNDFYAKNVIDGRNDGINKEEYIENLNNKYTNLAASYLEYTNTDISSNIQDYFYIYASIPVFDETRVLRLYAQQGQDYFEQLLAEYYDKTYDNSELSEYVRSQKAIASIYLTIAQQSSAIGCINNEIISTSCMQESSEQIYTSDLMTRLSEQFLNSDTAVETLYSNAINDLALLYEELYNVNAELMEGGAA